MLRHCLGFAVLIAISSLTGCNTKLPQVGGNSKPFSLAWSEYPSWSVFGVAHEQGLINKEEGLKGSIEEKYGIDIVLQQQDYDTCLTGYASGTVDAVCITNMDALAPSLGRDSVAILPTSTSDGADACIVEGIESVDELAGKNSYGLEKSVSQYMFERNLEEMGKDPARFPFKNMDPGNAALAMQAKQQDIQSIVVWNPFVLQTLRVREGETKVLFDSTTIPEEIIDMVVVGKDALSREGGRSFAAAVVETFYKVNDLMESPTEGDSTLVALGSKFSNLGLEDMKIVVEQTKFYKTPDQALALFEKEEFQQEIMPKVVEFCATHAMVDQKPTVSFDGSPAQLAFTSEYINMIGQARSAEGDTSQSSE